jgi:hypothetical protein
VCTSVLGTGICFLTGNRRVRVFEKGWAMGMVMEELQERRKKARVKQHNMKDE